MFESLKKDEQVKLQHTGLSPSLMQDQNHCAWLETGLEWKSTVDAGADLYNSDSSLVRAYWHRSRTDNGNTLD